jgi:predicted NBD/HSP70 family sugar kinase
MSIPIAGIKCWLAEAVPALRHAACMLESLLDPEIIVVGGSLSNDILERLIGQSMPLFPSVSVRAARAQA